MIMLKAKQFEQILKIFDFIVFFCFRAVNLLNGVEVEGKPLKVELAGEKRSRRGPRGPGAAFGGIPGQSRQTDFPLRILVQSDMVRNDFSSIQKL